MTDEQTDICCEGRRGCVSVVVAPSLPPFPTTTRTLTHLQVCFCPPLIIALPHHHQQAVFPEGTPGSALDALARLPLWSDGLNYRHGTGEGGRQRGGGGGKGYLAATWREVEKQGGRRNSKRGVGSWGSLCVCVCVGRRVWLNPSYTARLWGSMVMADAEAAAVAAPILAVLLCCGVGQVTVLVLPSTCMRALKASAHATGSQHHWR